MRRLQSLASEKDCGNPLAMSAMGIAWENYIPYAMSLLQQVRYYAGEPMVSPTLIAQPFRSETARGGRSLGKMSPLSSASCTGTSSAPAHPEAADLAVPPAPWALLSKA